jgi:hypothetical protein
MNKYLDRKKSELNILIKYIDNFNYDLKKIKSQNDLFRLKDEIVKQLRDNSVKKYYHHLTNNEQISFDNKFFEYKYTYERFNGFLNVENFAKKFYHLDNKNENQTYFTNCGMSSIVSVLTSLILCNDMVVDLLYEETYFETIKFINTLTKKDSTKKVLYMDSIASDFNFNKIDLSNYDCIIIDTTCYNGEDFSDYVSYILSCNKFCILVRSHTKLDLLSTEYSHIGSVSFIYPKDIDENKIEFYKKIELDCRHLIGVYGACLPPEKYPEFLLDKKLHEVNLEKMKIVKNNNEILYRSLLQQKIKIIMPNHKQFCLIYLDNNEYSLNDLKKEVINFCNENKQYYIKHAVSFGFDYIAIDVYQNFVDNTYKMRVCVSDLSLDNVNNFRDILIKFITKLNKKM